MKAMRALFLAAAVAAVSGGCERERPDATATAPAPGTATAPTITSPAGTAPADAQAPTVAAGDSRYLSEALERGMGHIELAQSVSGRSQTPAVYEAARQIIDAHNEINADLARVAARASVTLPADAAPELKQTVARLDGLTGKNLDAAYLAMILQTYPDLIRLHASAATTATDMEVKNIAVRAKPLFEANLRRAREAYAQVTGTVVPPEPESGSVPPATATSS